MKTKLGCINLQQKLQEYQLPLWYIFKLRKDWFENLRVSLELWAHNNNLQRPFAELAGSG